jgi:hypothetical protein
VTRPEGAPAPAIGDLCRVLVGRFRNRSGVVRYVDADSAFLEGPAFPFDLDGAGFGAWFRLEALGQADAAAAAASVPRSARGYLPWDDGVRARAIAEAAAGEAGAADEGTRRVFAFRRAVLEAAAARRAARRPPPAPGDWTARAPAPNPPPSPSVQTGGPVHIDAATPDELRYLAPALAAALEAAAAAPPCPKVQSRSSQIAAALGYLDTETGQITRAGRAVLRRVQTGTAGDPDPELSPVDLPLEWSAGGPIPRAWAAPGWTVDAAAGGYTLTQSAGLCGIVTMAKYSPIVVVIWSPSGVGHSQRIALFPSTRAGAADAIAFLAALSA